MFVSNSAGILMKQAQRSMKQRVGESHSIFRKFPFGDICHYNDYCVSVHVCRSDASVEP